jgi:peptide/nickel transport system substrate-binding protein
MSRPPTRLRLLAAVAAIAALVTACGGSGSGSSDGTTIVEAVAAVPGGLAFDAKPGGYEAFEYTLLTGATLIRNPYVQATDDANAKTQDLYGFEGVLAESYELSPDQKTFTFHLRQGVVSQAGNPFTADDVIYSYQRKWKTTSIAKAISFPAITDPDTQLKKVDDHTVSWTVAEVGHGFPLLAVISKISGEIYDQELLEQHATAEDPYAVNWSNTNGNFGFGPYTMESYQDGQQITYRANPNYPLGKPAADRIIQRVVPDAANRASLVRNGDVDVAVQLRPSDVADLGSAPGVTTFSADTNNFLWAFMQTQTAPFDDVRVRQAMFKAIPYQQIIDQVYKGRANPVVGLLNPGAPNYVSTGLQEQDYDPAGAKALLAEAGHTTPLPVTILMSNAVPDLQEAAVQIQSFASDAGFAVTLDVVPPAVFQERQNSKQFQMMMMRDMSVSYESPPYSLLLAYNETVDARNSTMWRDPAYYDAVEKGVSAGDALSPEAMTYWNQAEQVWQAGRPQVQIAKAQPLMAFANGTTGFVHRTDNVLDFSVMSKTASD